MTRKVKGNMQGAAVSPPRIITMDDAALRGLLDQSADTVRRVAGRRLSTIREDSPEWDDISRAYEGD